MKILTSVLIIFFTSEFYDADSQSQKIPLTEKDIAIHLDKVKRAIDLSFTINSEVNNLSIIISDDKGQTVFLDDQIFFKGEYKKHIDLENYGNGKYSLVIKGDNFECSKEIVF